MLNMNVHNVMGIVLKPIETHTIPEKDGNPSRDYCARTVVIEVLQEGYIQFISIDLFASKPEDLVARKENSDGTLSRLRT